MATRRPNDAANGGVDHYVVKNERGSVNQNESCSEQLNEDDVTENEIRPKPASRRDVTSPLSETPSWTENENDIKIYMSRKPLRIDAQILPCPEYRKTKTLMTLQALKEGNTIFDITPPPTTLKNTDTSQKNEILATFLHYLSKRTCIFIWDYSDFFFFRYK